MYMKQPTKVALILSPGRSGQTWLNLMLGAHPRILSVGELALVEKVGRFDGACSVCDGECPFWSEFDRAWDRKTNLFEALARQSGKPVVSIVGSHRFKEHFAGDGLEVYTIRLIRDGRAVTASYLRKYAETPYEDLVARWVKQSAAMDRKTRRAGPGRGLTLRYEDLVEDTPGRLGAICRMMGLEYDPGMIDYWRTLQHIVAGNQGTVSFMRGHFGLKTPAGYKMVDEKFYKEQMANRFKDVRWRQELGPERLRQFEMVGGVLNKSYGYGTDVKLGALDRMRRALARRRG